MKLNDLHARLRAARLASSAAVDMHAINDTIRSALAAAGLGEQSPLVRSVNDTIQQALASAGLAGVDAGTGPSAATIDGVARRIDTTPDETIGTRIGARPRAKPGEFVIETFTNDAGTRDYKLYLPTCANEPAAAMPLVVMLHGCTQSPDDFAAGTRMNELAEQHGFAVLYPAQAVNANNAKCWNWFRAQDQRRDAGEPSLIAGMTRAVVRNHAIDARRVFVAGLSAGGAMAVILGRTYPDLFAAIGVHSGLPFGAAHDVASAFLAMSGSAGARRSDAADRASRIAPLPPTIVFHGDSDSTVHAKNGSAIVQDAASARSDATGLRAETYDGVSPGGRAFRRTTYIDDGNACVVEDWLLHGAGHAWSGGSATGSFTDPAGPDASAEIVRFFLSQRRAGTA